MPLLTSGPSRFLGGRSGLTVPTPAFGAELITNGGMELDSNWNSSNTPATNERSTEQVHGGTYSRKLVTNGGSQGMTSDNITSSAGQWFVFNGWIYVSNGQIKVDDINATLGLNIPRFSVTNAWVNFIGGGRKASASSTALIAFTSGVTNSTCYIDDWSCKQITLASMFSAKAIGITDAIIKAKVTRANTSTYIDASRAGVVGWLDSKTSPANFLIASHDGTNAMLSKCVGGTYTSLVNAAATYAAGAYVEIRRTVSTNTFALYYNGSKVGTDQTVSDAGIISNTLAGYFATYTGAIVSDFSAVAS